MGAAFDFREKLRQVIMKIGNYLPPGLRNEYEFNFSFFFFFGWRTFQEFITDHLIYNCRFFFFLIYPSECKCRPDEFDVIISVI